MLKYNEQALFFLAILVICTGQAIGIIVGDDWSVKIVATICSLIIALPLMLFVIIRVNKHNYLVEYGKVIKATLYHNETKFIHVRSIVIVKIVCFYTCEEITHMFKDEYSISMYEYKKIKEYINNLNELEVLVDDTYKRYEILLGKHIGRQNGIDLKVPYVLNLCAEAGAVICFLTNIMELLI